jgi:SnoaL-like domain
MNSVLESYCKAWNKRDMDGVLALFRKDAEFEAAQTQFRGLEAISHAYEEDFEKGGATDIVAGTVRLRDGTWGVVLYRQAQAIVLREFTFAGDLIKGHNHIENRATIEKKVLEQREHERLTTGQQWGSMFLGAYLAGALVIALGAFILLALIFLKKDLTGIWEYPLAQQLILGFVGGLFGGSARALYMFHVEVGGHTERPASHYLASWPLFVIKPVIGGASGALFAIAAYLGVGRVIASSQNVDFLPTFFIAAIGGIFFEEVFGALHNLVRTPRRESNRSQ